MYAEQFNAPSWLEGPSQWLWWAMQSRINGQLEQATYNLQKFWESLGPVKAAADETTWPEILALDSQSHIQAANITSGIINEMERDLNRAAAWIRFFSGTIYNQWKDGNSSQAAILKMQEQRKKELETAAALAEQARTATALRAYAVAEQRISAEDAERASENRNVESIINAYSDDSGGFLGIPMWAWAIGIVGLVFVVKKL